MRNKLNRRKKKEEKKRKRMLGHEFDELESQGAVDLTSTSLMSSSDRFVQMIQAADEGSSSSSSSSAPASAVTTNATNTTTPAAMEPVIGNVPSSAKAAENRSQIPKASGLTFMQRFSSEVTSLLRNADENTSRGNSDARLDKIESTLDKIVDRFERMDERYLSLFARLIPAPNPVPNMHA
jgi:hypothetical protein